MTAIFVPTAALAVLTVPAMALDDGSAEPVWVELTAHSDQPGLNPPRLRLPFSADGAAGAAGWAAYTRRSGRLHRPAVAGLILIALAAVFGAMATRSGWLLIPPLPLLAAAAALGLRTSRRERELRPPVMPRQVEHGILLAGVPREVADEWARTVPGVMLRD